MPRLGPFPSKEADANTYFQAVVPYLITNSARLGVSPANETAMTDKLANWNAEFPATQNANTRTKTNVQNKDKAKELIITCLRSVYADIPASALTTADRNTLNLPLKDGTNTPSPVPHTRPVGQVSTSQRLEHTISFKDEDGKTAKPHGVRGSQIWFKIGEPAVDPSELTYMATDTSSPYTHKFKGEHAGEPVHYWLRWENTRGETGPWSDAVMATITG